LSPLPFSILQEGSMQVLYPRCAGLDIHKDIIVACVRCASAPEHREVQSFCSTTKGLVALSDWLAVHRCSHVAKEATGIYWKPVWHVLEGSFELVLGNAAHIRNVPGRKTDVNEQMRPICASSCHNPDLRFIKSDITVDFSLNASDQLSQCPRSSASPPQPPMYQDEHKRRKRSSTPHGKCSMRIART
jgi:endogenous inhibitor of DNA gyrase (YacG/DUF329 family)